MNLRPIRRLFNLSSLVFIVGSVLTLPLEATSDWPGLRGPSSDGAAREANLFPGGTAGLELAWKKELGSGYSAVVVGDGRAITMFAAGESDVMAAFDVESGNELWRYRVEETYVGHDGSHDGPISTPLLAGDTVYGVSARGRLFALDAATGAERWTRHLVEDLGGTKPWYGFSTSPVLADGVLGVQIGGGEGKSIVGLDAADGSLKWSLGDDPVNYHTPVVATIAGQRQFVAATSKTLAGIEPASGNLIWSFEHGGDKGAMGGETIIPIPAGDDRILVMNKEESSAMLQVSKEGSEYTVEELWASNAIRGSYVHPVIHDGYIYGMAGRIFACADAATGERKWRSREPGDGFPTLVGDHLVIITKPGTLHIAEASPEAYKEVARLDLFEDHSWSAVAYADGHLFARSMAHLARIDPAQAAPAPQAEAVGAWLGDTAFGRFLAGLEKAEDRQAAVDRFLAEQESFPIIESSGAVHLVFQSDASDVGVVGDMIGYRREDPMHHVAGTDLFYYSTRLEPNAAVSYGFIPNYESVVPDPRNDRKAVGLFGEVSFFAMPGWPGPAFPAEVESRGRIETVEWESEARQGQKRRADIYLPAGYDDDPQRRYPVLYFHDGQSALENGQARQALDHFIGERVEPLIAVFVHAGENTRRDFGDRQGYAKMIVEELMPKVDADFRTRSDRMHRGHFGAGDAGSAALYLAFRHPDLFGKVGALGAVMMTAEGYGDLLGSAEEQTMVVYQEWGTYHLRSPHEAWDMGDGNRELWQMLRERGYRPAGGEVPDGYGWACWKARTDDWLPVLFPL